MLKSVSLYKDVKDVLVVCPQNCGKTYKSVYSLNKHLKYECNKPPQFRCLFCEKMAKRPDNLKTHMRLVHGYNETKNHRCNVTYNPNSIISLN